MNFCIQCSSKLVEAVIDGEIRPACPDTACGYIVWNNPTPVVAIIVEMEDGVVMAHNVSWPPHVYSVITGFLEANEDPAECALREMHEELGLVGTEATLVGCYSYAQQNQVILAYHVKAFGQIKLNHELDDYKIIAKDKLKVWPMGTGLAIKDWLEGQGMTPEILG